LTVNISILITNFGLADIIADGNFGLATDSFNGFLPFVHLDDIFRCCGRLLPRTFFVAFGCGWSGAGSRVLRAKVETDMDDLELETNATTLELETNAATLELETDVVVLDLETETDVSQEISKHERYSAD
jgi:hypothetical protein